jgi:hypothetical protein
MDSLNKADAGKVQDLLNSVKNVYIDSTLDLDKEVKNQLQIL